MVEIEMINKVTPSINLLGSDCLKSFNRNGEVRIKRKRMTDVKALVREITSAMNTNLVKAEMQCFDSHYNHRSMLMENFLRSKEYWQVVKSGVREPAKDAVMTDAQKIELDGRKLKDSKAKIYLIQAIDRPILETILSKETSKDIWDSMKKKYQGSSRVKRARLQALRRDHNFGSLPLSSCFVSSTMGAMVISTLELEGNRRYGEEVGKLFNSIENQLDYDKFKSNEISWITNMSFKARNNYRHPVYDLKNMQ
ncbi:hypothetical protein RJ640_005694 [Escallonia rubra]|uniref:Retrovirus-related Pol polyprotein from transposon TNT 1-94 n=1 Tax=Escallonia rubra TaxID=112253 RepID=A0AA88UVZ9_9ASTE|nr:hypothetical protein RJ640_005694 [Escallonia rubra]